MRFDQAIKAAKELAAQRGASVFVVHEPAPQMDDAEAFHFADRPGVVALFREARCVATVHPDGRIVPLAPLPVAA
jgi:hypothetical protein